MISILKSFAALSDETRMSIVDQLIAKGELPAGDLAPGAGISAPAISRHLKVLREAGLVTQRADGTRRLYSARPEGLRMIAEWTQSRRAFWEGGLDRLEAALMADDT
ncbi:metalloregulator ArsR/SmtB family transcription factor [Leisingera sp. M527]|uniref:ArsR/SmtB family transcription factor n=1 Tax=Leisingera sp. M527 TaxID=2867014 RepID=UPI0021A830B3|nr:metalloregulator ArsR/SmtB family transcription factor [Leisingera sp. M527]UWQ32946.1 metalloregulator ArsR/SmtB family transcription factor [Leisingera sp. M527]